MFLSHGYQVTRQVEKENMSLCSRLIFPRGIGPWGLTLSKKWNLALTCWRMGPRLNSLNISPSTGRVVGRNQMYSPVWYYLLCYIWYGVVVKCFRRLRGCRPSWKISALLPLVAVWWRKDLLGSKISVSSPISSLGTAFLSFGFFEGKMGMLHFVVRPSSGSHPFN